MQPYIFKVKELNGYRLLYFPEHRKAMTNNNWKGYVYEHIVIAEKFLERELRNDEVVHHLNGNRKDNRYVNLLILSRSQHSKLHVWINSGTPGLESLIETGSSALILKENFELKICKVCNIMLQEDNKETCSYTCDAFSKRKVERPSKEQLEDDLKSLSMVNIGRKYGVSDNAVRKWIKTYSICK